jgi:hypothetical protein
MAGPWGAFLSSLNAGRFHPSRDPPGALSGSLVMGSLGRGVQHHRLEAVTGVNTGYKGGNRERKTKGLSGTWVDDLTLFHESWAACR